MAQGIENGRQHRTIQEDDDSFHPKTQAEGTKPLAVSAALDKETVPSTLFRSFALSRHATLSPHLEVAHCDYGITHLEWESPTATGVLDAATPDTWQGLPLDGVRTSTMAFWAGAVQAPFFLMLYRLYDRILPTAITPYAVGSRVALSFVTTIPFTAAFFGYGTFVHHLLYRQQTEKVCKEELDISDADERDDSFWADVADQIQEKWSNDLGATLQTSASVWVPFNAINFSIVPPHLRPLSMMAMSASWNCYLSLVQHKD